MQFVISLILPHRLKIYLFTDILKREFYEYYMFFKVFSAFLSLRVFNFCVVIEIFSLLKIERDYVT